MRFDLTDSAFHSFPSIYSRVLDKIGAFLRRKRPDEWSIQLKYLIGRDHQLRNPFQAVTSTRFWQKVGSIGAGIAVFSEGWLMYAVGLT